MSQNNEPAFPAQAYDKLVNGVHKPVFLQKLSRDWGVVPHNEVEEQQLLEMAGSLRRVDDEETTKQASAGNTLISEASDRLKVAVARRGYPAQPTTRDRLIEKAASDAVYGDPDLAEAALQFGDYVARLGAGS